MGNSANARRKLKSGEFEVNVMDENGITTLAYDANFGRVKSMQYPNDLTIKYTYNTQGYLATESNAASNYVYRTVTVQNAFGNITNANYGDGNKVSLAATYSGASGQMLTNLATGSGNIQKLGYFYDSYGNLTQQDNYALTSTTQEIYGYDKLHRLTSLNIIADGTTLPTVNYGYDAAGNFEYKSDYSTNSNGAYQYVAGSNKISQVSLKSGSTVSFGYDNKGNQTTRNGTQEVWYNSFNKPVSINRKGVNLSFVYGADLARYKQTREVEGKTIITHYIDKHYEVEIDGSHTRTKSYISDAAIVSDGDEATDRKLHFTLRDRLGSATTFADHHGAVTEKRHFDPFGKPRNGDWAVLDAATLANNLFDFDMPSRRGFTDHEHLDEAQLIHMNGRVYDYNLGRFMSVDPFIQAPGNSQSINPYSYIMNNPLSGIDPTGYTFENEKKVAVTGSRIKREVSTSGNSVTSSSSNVKFSGSFNSTKSSGNGAKVATGSVNNAVPDASKINTEENKSKSTSGTGTFSDSQKADLEEAREAGITRLNTFKKGFEEGRYNSEELATMSKELNVDLSSGMETSTVIQRFDDAIANLREATFVPNTEASLRAHKFEDGSQLTEKLVQNRLKRIGKINAFVFSSDETKTIFVDGNFFSQGMPYLGAANRLNMKTNTLIHEASHFNRGRRMGTRDVGSPGLNNAYDFADFVTKHR